MQGYRQKGRWIQIVRKEPGEERVRNRRSGRIQEGNWKIVRKEQGEERVRNRSSGRLQKGSERWIKIVGRNREKEG